MDDRYGCSNCNGDGWLDEATLCTCPASEDVEMSPELIQSIRDRLGLSQQGLADRLRQIDPLLKANRNIVSRWERGKNVPSAHAQAALRGLAGDIRV